MRIKKLATVLTGMIALSVVSYGTSRGNANLISTSGTTSPFGSSLAALSEFGVVQSIEAISPQPAEIGSDMAAQVVIEGMHGNRAVQCDGNIAVAIADSQIKNNTMKCPDPVYRVTLRKDDGSLQTYVQRSPLNLGIGDRVLVATDMIEQ